MSVWRSRSYRRSPRPGTKLARVPMTPEAGSWTRYGRHGLWRQWFPAIISFGLLALAPIIAHARGADRVVVRAESGGGGRAGTAEADYRGGLIEGDPHASACSVRRP